MFVATTENIVLDNGLNFGEDSSRTFHTIGPTVSYIAMCWSSGSLTSKVNQQQQQKIRFAAFDLVLFDFMSR